MRNLHNELLIALDEISKLDQEQNLYHQFPLSPDCIVDYTVLKVEDGGYELIDREVVYNDNQYCGYDEGAVSCWEVLDMNGFIDDNFEDIALDEISKLDQEQNLYHQFTLSPYCILWILMPMKNS